MVALYCVGVISPTPRRWTRLNYIWVQSALDQKLWLPSQFFFQIYREFIKNVDEFPSYNFSFSFRVCYSFEFIKKTLCCINTIHWKMKIIFKHDHHTLSLIVPDKTQLNIIKEQEYNTLLHCFAKVTYNMSFNAFDQILLNYKSHFIVKHNIPEQVCIALCFSTHLKSPLSTKAQ